MRLANRVACVTGGGSGLGRAMAEVFAAEGASIAVNDLNPTTAKTTVEALPGEGHIAVPGDVSDSARVAEIFAEVDERFGRLDVLVNNAGVDRTEGDGFDKLAEADTLLTVMGDRGFSRMLEIHLHGAFFCTREAVKIMLGAKAGSIINMARDPLGKEWIRRDGTILQSEVTFSGLQILFVRLPPSAVDSRTELLDAEQYPRLWGQSVLVGDDQSERMRKAAGPAGTRDL